MNTQKFKRFASSSVFQATPRLIALKALATRHGLNGLQIKSASTAKQGRKVFKSLMNRDQLNMYNYSVGHPTRVDLYRSRRDLIRLNSI